MGRLSSVRSTLGSVPSRLASVPVDTASRDKERNAFNPLRALYKTKEWRRLRWSILTRDLFTCQMCGRLEANTAKLVCDHRHPHRGDLVRFWDPLNLWTLCKPCHDGAKQREEQAARNR